MGIDFERILGKLEDEKKRKISEEENRRAEMEKADRAFISHLHRLSRGLSTPKIEVGTKLYKPVYSELRMTFASSYWNFSDKSLSFPAHVVDRVSEVTTVLSMDEAWVKTEKGSWMCRVTPASSVPFTVVGQVVGSAWCVSPGTAGVVCFLVGDELPPSGWTWLEVTKVSRRPGSEEGQRERVTLFARPVVGSQEEHLGPFGFGQLGSKALEEMKIPLKSA